MLAIVPEDRFLTYLKWFTDAFDMRYGYVIGQRPEPGAPDVAVDVTRLNAALDLVEKALPYEGQHSRSAPQIVKDR